MARKFDVSAPQNGRLVLPKALAMDVLMSGLTAPGMRAALVLAGHAAADGRIDMLKPQLEKLSGTRIDNGHRFVDRLGEAVIDIPGSGDPEVGHDAFSDLLYTPGIEKRLAGVITGQLSGAFLSAISAARRSGQVVLDLDVLRHLDTVAGILIYLRVQLERARAPGHSVLKLRLKDADAFAWFGQYCRQASTGRTNAAGEVFRSVSLGRIHRALIDPGIRDLAAAVDDLDIDAIAGIPETAVRGKAWSHVDIMVRKLRRVATISELDAAGRQQTAYEARKKA